MSPKLLILGLPRMGTQSIADAVEQLGYRPVYHMRDVAKNGHQEAWKRLLDKKFAGPTASSDEVGAEELEQILSPYSALADFPATIFAEELIRAYPTAKVVLLVRDEDAWFKSMTETLWYQFSGPEQAKTTGPMRSLAETYHRYCWSSDFPKYGREYLRDYYARIRAMAMPGDRQMEYSVKDGWEPLCTFLGVEVPDVPFPRKDDWRELKWRKEVDGCG
ncbi:hypothetical protein LTR85_008543 [Meristemomyces frigidus]|nr:hypothetical protein LTR85_008543 [Meristemomyces frigidus]